MKQMAWARRTMLALMAVTTLCGVGCGSSADEPGDGAKEFGELRLPLATQGSSGTEYRLRDATFEITPYYYYWDYEYGAAGSGGTTSAPIVISSEDDPSAASISVELEQGEYIVRLLPGWRMEKVAEEGAETVEATLLSSESTWVWVSPHSTSWAEYQFGIGSKEIWLNGELNIEIDVYEDPDEYYGGYAGYGGSAGSGGSAGGVSYGGEPGWAGAGG
jgi:hypothetical protein